MSARILVTIAVQQPGGRWDPDRTLTLAGPTVEQVEADWLREFPAHLRRVIERAANAEPLEPEDEEARA